MKENDSSVNPNPSGSSSIFGGAKPVDTTRKEKEIEEKLKTVTVQETLAQSEPAAKKPGGGGNIFGAAKPVDTSAKEKEIEERLRKKQREEKENADAEKGQKDEREG